MKEEESKNHFTKKGKISLMVVIIALALSLISIILSISGVKLGVILIIIAISANLIAMVGMGVFMVDRIKQERIKNPQKLSRELEKVGYFISGIFIGIMISSIF